MNLNLAFINQFYQTRYIGNSNQTGKKQSAYPLIHNKNLDCKKGHLQCYFYGNTAQMQRLTSPRHFWNYKSQLRHLNRPSNFISFKCKKSFKDFMEQVRKLGKTHITVDTNKRLGEGKFAVVYEIDGMHDYVIKISKKLSQQPTNIEIEKIIPVQDDFEGRNFGHPVGKINDDIHILMRQAGQEHSIRNWIYYRLHPDELTVAHAQKFLKDINRLSQMPDKAFRGFAESIKYLSDKGYKADFLNPENILIDYEKKSINMVDIFDWKNIHKLSNRNTCFDMFLVLLDFAFFEKYYNLLGSEQKEELIKNSRIIVDKCKIAAKEVGLSMDEQIHYDTLDKLDVILARIYSDSPDKSMRERYDILKKFIGNVI